MLLDNVPAITDHNELENLATGDVHTQYQLRSEKSAANGYASLDGSGDVPIGELPTGTPGGIAVGDAAAEGVAVSVARSDHTHSLPAPAAPANVTKAAAAAGVSTNVARADHKHDVSTAAAGAVSPGASSAEGSATSLARSDHAHSVAVAAPVEITDSANGAGVATSFVRSDHTHAHGNRGGGSLHALAVASGAAGFLSGADKAKIDGIPSGGGLTHFESAVSLGVSSTTLTGFQTKVTLTTAARTGTYLVLAMWDMSATIKDKEGHWRLQNVTDGVEVNAWSPWASQGANNAFTSGAAMSVVTYTGAAKTFEIQYRSGAGDQVNIKNARLVFFRAGP